MTNKNVRSPKVEAVRAAAARHQAHLDTPEPETCGFCRDSRDTESTRAKVASLLADTDQVHR